MKSIKYFMLLLMMTVFFVGCGSETQTDEGQDDSATETVDDDGEDAANANSNSALSNWEGHSVREGEASDSKWVASLAFGEEVSLLGESSNDPKNNKPVEKVKLSDGKEGWVRADFISKGATLGAVTADAQIYKRPSISNISDEMVASGTVVVLTGHKDEFSEFIAKNDANNKRKQGWLLGEKSLTTSQSDVAAALMLSKALAEKVPAKRKEKLQQVVDMYGSSIFAENAKTMLSAADASTKLAEDELMITGTNVNVRSAPDVTQDNKVFQLNDGDVCKIVKRGDMDEISGKLDYWYNISIGGKSGWVFGTFTSKAL